MYTLLLAAGILLLVFLGRREHLEFTDTIKNVRIASQVPQEEKDRIFALAPTSLQQRAAALTTEPKEFVVKLIAYFQTVVYVRATEPITEAVIDNYIAQARAGIEAIPPETREPRDTFLLEAYSNGDAKRLLMAYLGLSSGSTPPPLSTPPSSSVSIPRVLEQMRDNLLEYKMTGRTEYKSAYDGAKAWLDQYIASLNTRLTREADAITADVTTYQTANADMTKTQTDFTRLRTEGPQVEDAYLTVKKQMDNGSAPDTTNLYVKVGIAAGLALGTLALAFA